MIDVSLARRCEAHGYDYFSFRRSGGSGGELWCPLCGLWAWTQERHGFQAFARCATVDLADTDPAGPDTARQICGAGQIDLRPSRVTSMQRVVGVYIGHRDS